MRNVSGFKKMFSDYCNEQISKGNCADYDCEFCCINAAWHRIFEENFEDVEEWFEYEDSIHIDEQAKNFVAVTVESYLNGCYDNPDEYTPETVDSWKEYVWNTIMIDMNYGGGESYKHLYFYGKDKMMQLVETFLDNYDDVQPYVII